MKKAPAVVKPIAERQNKTQMVVQISEATELSKKQVQAVLDELEVGLRLTVFPEVSEVIAQAFYLLPGGVIGKPAIGLKIVFIDQPLVVAAEEFPRVIFRLLRDFANFNFYPLYIARNR